MEETKSIRVTKETYDRLAELGDLKDSFDTVIKKLLDKTLAMQRGGGD